MLLSPYCRRGRLRLRERLAYCHLVSSWRRQNSSQQFPNWQTSLLAIMPHQLVWEGDASKGLSHIPGVLFLAVYCVVFLAWPSLLFTHNSLDCSSPHLPLCARRQTVLAKQFILAVHLLILRDVQLFIAGRFRKSEACFRATEEVTKLISTIVAKCKPSRIRWVTSIEGYACRRASAVDGKASVCLYPCKSS